MAVTRAWRRNSLEWPPNREQWQAVNDTLEDLYRQIRKLQGTAGDGVTLPIDWADVSKVGSSLADIETTSAADLDSGTLPDARLAASGVSAGTYGDADNIPQITVDAKGRITSATTVAVDAAGVVVATSVYRSTNQTLTHNTEAAISFDTEHFDSDNMWVLGSPTKLTVATGQDGTYQITGQIQLGTGFAGVAHLRLYKNGTLVAANSAVGADLSSGSESHVVTAVLSLVATDYVELKVLLEKASGSGTFDVVGGTNATFFQAVKASPQASAVPASGALILLEQHTASASSSLDFTTAISATYDEYVIEIIELVPATDNTDLLFRCSTDGGSTYDSGNNYGRTAQVFNSSAAFFQGANSGLSSIILATNVDTTITQGSVCGTLRLFNPGGTSLYKTLVYQGGYFNNDTNNYSFIGQGRYRSTSAVNAFRFIMSSGNIASGKIRVYGVAKS